MHGSCLRLKTVFCPTLVISVSGFPGVICVARFAWNDHLTNPEIRKRILNTGHNLHNLEDFVR